MKRTTILLLATASLALASCDEKIDYKQYYLSAWEQICSPDNCGRSAYNDGDLKAAKIIMDNAASIKGLKPIGGDECTGNVVTPPYKSTIKPYGEGRWTNADKKYLSYLQNFMIPMNVMRGDMAVSIDGKELKATYDFTAKEFSPTCHGTFKVVEVPDDKVTEEQFVNYLNSGAFKDCFAVVNWKTYKTLPCSPFERYQPYLGQLNKENIAGVILKCKTLLQYFKARTYFVTDIPVIMVTAESMPEKASEIKVDIDAEMIQEHDCHNIVTYLPGTDKNATEYYTFIAHYDHLGLEGRDNMFPGANDNASGDAFLLTLAKYFSTHRTKHGIQFIWLDAEEENLLGSFYYCGNPIKPLSDIRFLINLDMVGDNGDRLSTECSDNGMEQLAVIQKINEASEKPFDIALHDIADNSDHYSFAESGVPSVFFETIGDYHKHYHTPRDTYENASGDNFDRLFDMIVKYIETTDEN